MAHLARQLHEAKDPSNSLGLKHLFGTGVLLGSDVWDTKNKLKGTGRANRTQTEDALLGSAVRISD